MRRSRRRRVATSIDRRQHRRHAVDAPPPEITEQPCRRQRPVLAPLGGSIIKPGLRVRHIWSHFVGLLLWPAPFYLLAKVCDLPIIPAGGVA